MWSGNTYASPNLDKVKIALEGNHLLEFTYFNSSNKKSSRTVEPYRLVLKEGSWYLKAYCRLREAFRIFKLNRMFDVSIMDSVFEPREFLEKALDGKGWIDQRIVYIKLKVHNDMRERVIERCKDLSIKSLDNDYVIVDFPFVEDELGYGILLSFGDKCECLEPEHIRHEVKRRIEKMMSMY